MAKIEVKTISQLKGFEEQIKSGAYLESLSAEDCSVNGSGPNGEVTMNDFSDLMMALANERTELTREWVVYTGYGGYMSITLQGAYARFGRKKLPRKLKKMYFKSEKDRRRYLPEYYKNQNYYKY